MKVKKLKLLYLLYSSAKLQSLAEHEYFLMKL